METGGDLMKHLVRFDELCIPLTAIGDQVTGEDKLVVLLRSLPEEYDGMLRIIEATSAITLLDGRDMLRRDFESRQKREQKETVLKSPQ